MDKITVDGKELKLPADVNEEQLSKVPERESKEIARQKKLIEKAKRKSAKRVREKFWTAQRLECLVGGIIALALGIVCWVFIGSTILRVLLGTLLCGLGGCLLIMVFEKFIVKTQSRQMLELAEFPERIVCGNGNDVLFNPEKHKLVVTNIYDVVSPVLNFSDISKLEVVEDNDTKIKYSFTGALIGDWAFGTLGAVIGARNMAQTKHYCNKLELVVYFKDMSYPTVKFTFVDKKIKKDSGEYETAMSQIRTAYSKLQTLMLAVNKQNN